MLLCNICDSMLRSYEIKICTNCNIRYYSGDKYCSKRRKYAKKSKRKEVEVREG